MTINQTTLYFKEGTSDKVYQTWIDQNAKTQEYCVNFAFGRRGSRLRTGTKTPSPVSSYMANKIYSDLIDSKLTKGYGYDYPIN
jgi:bifunctional non-homologous end joining protein LigD